MHRIFTEKKLFIDLDCKEKYKKKTIHEIEAIYACEAKAKKDGWTDRKRRRRKIKRRKEIKKVLMRVQICIFFCIPELMRVSPPYL